MTIETALYPSQLDTTSPPETDLIREGAAQIRLLKTVFKTAFPYVSGPITATHLNLSKVGVNPVAGDYSVGPSSTQWVKDRIAEAAISPGVAVPDYLLLAQGVY